VEYPVAVLVRPDILYFMLYWHIVTKTLLGMPIKFKGLVLRPYWMKI
jgi:hypothetical protein